MSANLDIVTVDEIMTASVVTVSPDDSAERVASILTSRKISGVPVVDESGQAIGMVTEFDLISKIGKTARDMMSRGVISVTVGTPAEDVANILSTRRVRRVPVMDGDKLVGIVSRSDLIHLFGKSRWSCDDCGYFIRGLIRPRVCFACGSTHITLQREPPGM